MCALQKPEQVEQRAGTTTERDAAEYRSVDQVIDGVKAVGELAAGTGALAVGIAKVKESFGGNESGQQPAPVEQQPASPEQS